MPQPLSQFSCVCLCVFMFMCVCVWVGAHLPCTRVSMYMEVRGQLQLSFLRCVHLGYFSGLELAKEARMATREPWGSSCFCFSCWNYNHVTQCLSFFFFKWVLGIELRSSFLQSKCFTQLFSRPSFCPQFTLLGKLFTCLLGHHRSFDHGMSASRTWLPLPLSLPKFKSK